MHGPGRGAISAPLENLALGGRQLDFPSPTPAILPRPQHESFIPTHPYAIALASPPAPKPSPSPAPSPLEIQFGVAMASPAAGSQYYYAYPPAEDLRFPAGGSKRTGYVPYRKPSRDETESPPPPAPSSVRSDSLSAGTSPSSFEGTYASVPTTISSKEPRGFRGKPGFRDATGVLKGEDRGQQSGNRIHMRAGSAKETLREMMVGFIPPDVPPPNPSYPPSIYPLPPILEVLSPRPTEITMGVGVEIAEINNLKSAWDSDDEGGGKNKKKKKEAKWDKKRRRNPSERDRQEMEVLDTSLPDAEKLLNGPRFSVNTVMREVAGAQDRVKNGIDDRVLKSSPEVRPRPLLDSKPDAHSLRFSWNHRKTRDPVARFETYLRRCRRSSQHPQPSPHRQNVEELLEDFETFSSETPLHLLIHDVPRTLLEIPFPTSLLAAVALLEIVCTSVDHQSKSPKISPYRLHHTRTIRISPRMFLPSFDGLHTIHRMN